ncbi:MAG: glycosyltransferase [Anaerolineae bacterium]|nr:glycosyltransferase [Anaerolineae bacterium]
MKEKPLISVVIPVHNGAATLPHCLEALVASVYENVEIIVVDDASTDDTPAVAARYPCRLLRLPENVGAARAKNFGAQEAKGEILFFTDADVYVPPPALAYVAEDLADPEVDGVVGLLARDCPHENFASQFKNLWMHFTYLRQPRRVGLFFTSAAAIRREIFIREGGFDPHYQGASITEDIEFGQRLLSRGYRIVMDKRLTVVHDKHYTMGDLLRTDLLRARGLMQTWLRNRLSKTKRAHYASVPWYFGAGVLMMGLATLWALAALALGQAQLLWEVGLFILGALVLNSPFLLALGRWRGGVFFLQSALFLLVDLYVSGLGILVGVWDFLRGKRY